MDARDLDRATWRKSSHSGGSGECVEVTAISHSIAVRDSKDPHGTKLYFSRHEWGHFLHDLKPSQPE